jgi:SpoIID/LytB domain protein
MCQVGAAVMALEGYNYRDILQHYYPGTTIKKVYSITNNH